MKLLSRIIGINWLLRSKDILSDKWFWADEFAYWLMSKNIINATTYERIMDEAWQYAGFSV